MNGKEIELYVNKLKRCNSGDCETDHYEADIILCDVLNKLGYEDIVKEYEKIGKWYA